MPSRREIIRKLHLRRLRRQKKTTRLVVPVGKKAGCLPRKHEPGKLRGVPLLRDAEGIDVLPEEALDDYAGKSDLAEFVPDIFDQDGVGSCAAESSTQALQIVRALSGLPEVILNPWTVYQYTSGGRDRGSNIGDNIRRLTSVGALPQEVWPRSKGWRAKLPSGWTKTAKNYRFLEGEVFEVYSKAEFATALILQYPVVYGRRNHAIVAVEWLPGDRVLYANSWDESWGDGGFGIDTWRSISRAIANYGAYAMRACVVPNE